MARNKYDWDLALPLVQAGMTFGQVCVRLGYDPRYAASIQRKMRQAGYAAAAHALASSDRPEGFVLPPAPPRPAAGGKSRPALRRSIEEAVAEETKFERSQTGDTMTLSGVSEIDNPEQLIARFKIDTQVWKASEVNVTEWQVAGFKRPVGSTEDGWAVADGDMVVRTLYRVNVRMRLCQKALDARIEIEAMLADLRAASRVYAPPVRSPLSGSHYAVVSCYDLHMGKLAYGKETSHGNYDSDIAQAMFDAAIDDLLAKVQGFGLERICFPVGNDLLNTEAGSLATTGLTAQNVDGRPKKTFRQTWKMLVAGIDRMREVAPVDVIVVPGNHAEFSEFAIGEVLDAWYDKCPDVSVDNGPALRKYYQFGKCMICFTHGNRESHARLPGIVAAERPDLWAASTAGREINIGHFHKVALNEYPGIRLRTLPSLCAPDQWHAATGWVGSRRSAEAYIWDKDAGLVGSAIHNPAQ